MADDYSDDINTKGRLNMVGQTRGTFEESGDRDWFSVSLSANTTYLFSLNSVAGVDGTPIDTSWVSLDMFNSQGRSQFQSYSSSMKPLFYSYNNNGAPVLQFTPATTGTYYLSAQADLQRSLGDYSLTMSLPAADEFSEDIRTNANLTADASVAGSFQRFDDTDWIRFHAEAGQAIQMRTEFGGRTLPDPYLTIYDSTGLRAVMAYNGVFVANTSGDYYLALNANGRLGAYTQSMNLIADDYSHDSSRPGVLVAGGQVTGSIDYINDSDRFQIEVQAGNFYTLRFDAPYDYTLRVSLYDSNNAALSSRYIDDDGVGIYQFLAAKSGTYAVDIKSSLVGGKSLSYTLSLSSAGVDDVGNTPDSARLLKLDEMVAGRLEAAGDVDMFAVALSAGKTYRFELPFAMSADTYASPRLYLMGRDGFILGNGHNQQEVFSYTPTTDGIVYISVASDNPAAASHDYSVKVSAVQDDHGATPASAGRLSLGIATKGMLEADNDVDWYGMTLNAGAYYWFTLAPGSSPAWLSLLDANGNFVASGDASNFGVPGVLAFTAPTRGTYYVAVAASGVEGSYTIKAQRGENDDHGNDAAHATIIRDNVALGGKLELLADKDVFKLSAVAGTAYALELTPAGANANPNFTSYAKLDVSTNLRAVWTTDVYSTGKILKQFTATSTGDYYFTLSTTAAGIGGAYQISVTSQGLDDYSANSSTTGLLAPNAPVRGEIGTPGDMDWIKVRLEAGHSYAFNLQGARSGGGTLDTDTLYWQSLTLLTADGAFFRYPQSNVGEPKIFYTADTTGDYFLQVRSSDNKNGTYTLVATETSADATAPRLLSSTVESGAVDVFSTMKIVLTFNETMMTGAGITLIDSDGSAVYGLDEPLVAIGNTLEMTSPHYFQPGLSYTLSLPEGSVLDLAGNPWVGAHSYSFTVAEAVKAGTASNDYLFGSDPGRPFGLMLDGGLGIDTVYYGSGRDNWQVTRNSDGTASVLSSYDDHRDHLSSVERLLFVNGAYALDIDGAAGQVYRLYQAAFDRTPDQEGLGFWIAARDNDVSLHSVARDFVQSAEFIKLYGSAPSDAEFVKLLYNNVLHRTPDAAGSDFWLQGLANGATRAQVLTDFSESAENVAALATIIGNGFAYTPYG